MGYDTYDLKFTNINEDSHKRAKDSKKRRLLNGGEAILKQK